MLDIQNLELYLNYFAICISSFYITVYVFCKSQNIILKMTQWIYLLISGVTISLFFVFVRVHSVSFSHFFRFLAVPVLFSFLSKEKNNSFKSIAIAFISLNFVLVCEIIASILETTIYWMLGIIPNELVTYLVCVALTIILCVCFMRIRRFRNGFLFFQEEKNLGLGLSISAIVMILKCMNLRNNQEPDYLYMVYVFSGIIVSFGLYLWIRRSITAHYREKLQLKSEEHYQQMLEEREQEIEKLNEANAFLAKIVHRDNHLLSSLNTSIDTYFSSDDKKLNDNLLQEIQTLTKERGELIEREQIASKLLPTTGNLLIDSAINDLYIKAAARGINFDLTVSETLDEIIGKFISQTDLQTLLCDHIKDAIIAVEAKGEIKGKILVNLAMQNECYSITIYDNGVDFEAETLSKLGLERVTTYGDGSGIGFMTTFETMKNAYASLMITEFENKTPFSKSVAFRFDGENAFIIQSYRSEELKEKIQREDIVIQSLGD